MRRLRFIMLFLSLAYMGVELGSVNYNFQKSAPQKRVAATAENYFSGVESVEAGNNNAAMVGTSYSQYMLSSTSKSSSSSILSVTQSSSRQVAAAGGAATTASASLLSSGGVSKKSDIGGATGATMNFNLSTPFSTNSEPQAAPTGPARLPGDGEDGPFTPVGDALGLLLLLAGGYGFYRFRKA